MASIEIDANTLFFSENVGASSRAARPPATALVVEDSEVIGHLLQVLLESDGFAVTVVTNGAEVLQQARTLQPSVILLDLALPGMHGRDVLRVLKEDPATRHIPVLVLSAFPDVLAPAERQAAARILGKPFDVDELLSAVRQATRFPRPYDAGG